MAATQSSHGEKLRGMDPLPTQERVLRSTGRFGKMFSSLSSLAVNASQLVELSRLMRGGQNNDNLRIPAGFTYLGQFIDHDITFDQTSSLEQQNDPEALENFRTPAFELDSLYGSGPEVSRHLYDPDHPGKFFLDLEREFDLPRNSRKTALIGDPRNDENLIIAQLHLAFLKFHNAVFDKVDTIPDDLQGETRFEKTQRLVRWHYQWIVRKEFLPLLVGEVVVNDVFQNPLRFYRPPGNYPFMPIEFSVAAYRFGHSQVRPFYHLNDNPEGKPLQLFTEDPPNGHRQDLRGGPIEKVHAVNWKNFFDTGALPTPGANRASKLIDTILSAPLHNLPLEVVPHGPRSLAERNLLRGEKMGLPSGQDVATVMQAEIPNLDPLTDTEIWSGFPNTFQEQSAPLWFYILKEAELREGGMMLGKVGGYLVAEVFRGLLEKDSHSFLRKKSHWTPSLSSTGNFTIVDLLKLAGVDTQ